MRSVVALDDLNRFPPVIRGEKIRKLFMRVRMFCLWGLNILDRFSIFDSADTDLVLTSGRRICIEFVLAIARLA